MMIRCGWNKCAFEQSRHLWVSSWVLPLVSRILFDHVVLIVLSLDGHSFWVITRTAPSYKQIDLVIRDDGGRLYDRENANLSPLCIEPWSLFILYLKVLLIYAPVFIAVLCEYFFSLIPLLHISCSWLLLFVVGPWFHLVKSKQVVGSMACFNSLW